VCLLYQAMRITIGLVLALSFGCAGSAKQPTTTVTAKCPPYICGQNGTQTTGLAAHEPAVIQAVTLPSGEVVDSK
jgi:hypothetical protein